MKKYAVLISLLLVLAGCNKDMNENNNNSQEKDSYHETFIKDEYKNVFLDDAEINTYDATGKEQLAFLLFGMDGCGACLVMKNTIGEIKVIRDYVEHTYKSYYINLSEKKERNFNHKPTDSSKLKSEFSVFGTPTSVFMYGNKVLIKFPGLISKARLKETLEFFTKDENYNLTVEEIEKKLGEVFKSKGI